MTSLKDMAANTFPAPTIDQWREKSEASLKGKPIEVLETDTYEGIKLKPLYTKEDQNRENLSQFPGQGDFRRGNEPLGYISNDWHVAQKLFVREGESLREIFEIAAAKGQTAISFDVDDSIVAQFNSLSGVHEKYPFSVNGKQYHGQLFEQLAEFSARDKASGYVAADILALYAEMGAERNEVEKDYDQLAERVKEAKGNFPKLRTILVDTAPYHNGGANAVQELAIAAATAVCHIEQLKKRGLAVDDIIGNIVFQFSIGSNFFMELAKLRAARMIWSKIAEAYGANEENRKMIISAVTSSFTKTVYDPYVNLLRSGNEAFAAVLGSVQYLHVSPHNEPEGMSTEFSDRIARNIQLILKEEAHLTKTVDPAGGSWYIEALTEQLSQKGWDLFLEIEDKGGMFEVLKQGWIQQEIASVMEKREHDVFVRKQTIVGTNKYANLQDEPLNVDIGSEEGKTEWFIAPVRKRRLSEPFEQLRARAEKLAGEGKKPAVGLITLGKLRDHNARKDFMAGFLSPGGISVKESGEIFEAEEAINFIDKVKLNYFCICGSNKQYEESGLQLAEKIKGKFPHIRLYLAGIPDGEKEKWLNAGIDEFIHVKSNCYELLSSILAEMEVAEND